jgi:hypothetical protein
MKFFGFKFFVLYFWMLKSLINNHFKNCQTNTYYYFVSMLYTIN